VNGRQRERIGVARRARIGASLAHDETQDAFEHG
jgi:hypothetical protein